MGDAQNQHNQYKWIYVWKIREQNPYLAHLEFNMEVEYLVHLKQAFIGLVENLGMTYNVQEAFNMEGYFLIKLALLEENLCLLK